MHDLSALESEASYEDMEGETFDMEGEAFNMESEAFDMEGEENSESFELNEAEELEAAAHLLSVGSEAELDNFLGGLIGKAASALGKHVEPGMGNRLGGLLKGLARKALPMVAGALGGPAGAVAARGGLEPALRAFGLELEGLSAEDQELELARRWVRVANGTSRRMLVQRPAPDRRTQAHAALHWALGRYAPGLLRGMLGRRHSSRDHRYRYRGAYPGFPGYRSSYVRPYPYPYTQNPQDPPAQNPYAHGPYPQSAGSPSAPAPGSFDMPSPGPACPACPQCGTAALPVASEPAPGSASSAPATPTAAAGTPQEHEYSLESESEDEFVNSFAASGYRGSAGRWVRHGNRIIIYGA
jgi:hypothetical protein